MHVKKVVIIGSGFSGLSAARFMAKAGWQVSVVEKHAIPGGRARKMEAEGFTFEWALVVLDARCFLKIF